MYTDPVWSAAIEGPYCPVCDAGQLPAGYGQSQPLDAAHFRSWDGRRRPLYVYIDDELHAFVGECYAGQRGWAVVTSTDRCERCGTELLVGVIRGAVRVQMAMILEG